MEYFLSYSRSDAEVAKNIVDGLEARGVGPFLDTKHISPGARWDQAIQTQLRDCKGIIVLLSKSAVVSENVLDEVGFALDHHKMVVPVVLEDCEVPLRLRRFEWLRLHDSLEYLVERLSAKLESGAVRRNPLEAHSWDRPSIVVLPFRCISSDEETKALRDGLLHEIVESLSLNREFFVISTGTSLAYKNEPINLPEISNDLGVRYAVYGTLQRHNEKLRVNMELINATTERVLLVDHYEGEWDDYFQFQSDMSRAIAVALQPKLTREEIKRAVKKSTAELSAWEIFQRARTYNWSFPWLKQSIDELRRAVNLDPHSAQPRALLAARLAYLVWYGEFDQFGEAQEHLEVALELQPQDPFIQVASCIVNMHMGTHQRALEATEKAIEANPNLAEAWAYYGACLGITGDNKQGLRQIDMAFRLSPRDPLRYIWHLFRMVCLVGVEDYEGAISAGRESIRLNQEWFFVHMSQAVNHAMLGQTLEARESWNEAKRLNSQVSVEAYRMWLHSSQLTEEHQNRMVAALQDSGCE